MTPWKIALALAVAAAAIVLTVSLGNWQLRRAAHKQGLELQWDALMRAAPALLATDAEIAAAAGRLPLRVRLSGRFLHEHTVWLDNRQHDGRPGFWVVTPLQLDGARRVVLVNRGWAPRNNQQRAQLPPAGRPAGVVEVDGVAQADAPRLLDLGGASAAGPLPAIWQNLDFDAFERASGLAVAPLVVQQISSLDDRLLRDWPRPAAGVDRHRGYALQWYALAALIAGLALWFGGRALWRRRAPATDGRR